MQRNERGAFESIFVHFKHSDDADAEDAEDAGGWDVEFLRAFSGILEHSHASDAEDAGD